MGHVTKSGSITIKNKDTGEEATINAEDLYFEVVETDERSMGTESRHNVNNTYAFDNGGEFTLDINVWEYPNGGYNNQDVKAYGVGDTEVEVTNNLQLGIDLNP
ncbi:hypothetical protein [Fodinibius sp.]|uniref:hypothetical protein n=1 Tax=Fodinibius sp. TaxID=1872440 RepID=UPI002ACD1FC2|nr:hypothetical protein [Fodinibius sp.]MDZ7660058.1 hypothetical protein [Fodinibius sp.]